MIYVLDASVAVAAVRENEPGHNRARARLEGFLAGIDEVVVPAIFDAEVSSALVRRGIPAAAVARYVDGDLAARRLVTMGPRASRGIVSMVQHTRLRAADAAYVWTAASRGLVLVTLDAEIGTKVGGLCRVEAP